MHPIVFNPGKHHIGTIAKRISMHVENSTQDQLIEKMKDANGLIDIYVGKLSAQSIERETLQFLRQHDLLEFAKYQQYLETQGDMKRRGYYTQIELSDTSMWTLRLIEEPTKFVHLHPSRYSPNTFRIRANTMKTAIMAAFTALVNNTTCNIDIINQARQALAMTPIAEVTEPIENMVREINSHLQRGIIN